MGIKFDVVPGSVEEVYSGAEDPAELVCRLALMKARDVADRALEDCLVLAADTVVYKDRLLGKPADREEAIRMLEQLQNGWHDVYTGLALVDMKAGYESVCYERTRVEMMGLTREQIESYIDSGEYADKAGAYAVQGLAAAFIPRIIGCYFNVKGLPVNLLYRELLKYTGTVDK